MTTPPRKTASKPKAATKPAKKRYVKPVPKKVVQKPAVASKPALASTASTEASPVVMKKKDLIDRVVIQSGLKKKDVKPVVEAMLEVMAKSLADNEEMNIQPFGKLMIKRSKELENAHVMVCKIRQSKTNTSAPVIKLATNS